VRPSRMRPVSSRISFRIAASELLSLGLVTRASSSGSGDRSYRLRAVHVKVIGVSREALPAVERSSSDPLTRAGRAIGRNDASFWVSTGRARMECVIFTQRSVIFLRAGTRALKYRYRNNLVVLPVGEPSHKLTLSS
jgi:hypothetical protein